MYAFRLRYILIFGFVSCLILMGAGVLTVQQLNLLRRNSEAVSANYESMLHLEILLSKLKDIETGTRGFMITKDSAYLEPYFEGRTVVHDQIVPTLASERRLMGRDTFYSAQLDSLKMTVDERLAISSRLIELAGIHPEIDKTQLGLLARGKKNMDHARRFVVAIRAYRQDILQQQTQQLLEYTQNIPLYVWGLSGVAISILLMLFYMLTRQLSELRAYRDTLETRFVELRSAYENLGRYSTLANHHLKEPVRKMLLFLDRYSSRNGGAIAPMEREMLDKMRDLSQQMYRLLEGVTLFSELDVQNAPLSPAIDLNELLKDVLLKLEPDFEAAQARVDVQADLPVIAGKPDLIRYIFFQLIENGLKYARPDAPARISIRAEKGPVDPETEKPYMTAGVRNVCRIIVADNGRGIPKEYHEQIFQLFFQFNAEGKTEGTGLGLALCQKIARLHGGFIALHSEEHNGSVFSVVLPA